VSGNGGDGIRVGFRSFVLRNNCNSNGSGLSDGASIHATGNDNRIEGNTCSISDRGIDVDVNGNIVIRNTCSGNTTNWDIVVGNSVAPIVSTSTNAAAILGSTYSGSLGSTDPNANFTY
jgi:parallel beta-helix repeat protein